MATVLQAAMLMFPTLAATNTGDSDGCKTKWCVKSPGKGVTTKHAVIGLVSDVALAAGGRIFLPCCFVWRCWVHN
jgi:hypothetical protein